MKMADFMNYNTAFPGHQTAMPNPFLGGDGLVKYDDGTPATVDNYARDVVAFLAWAADPRLEERKRTGAAGDGLYRADHRRAARPRQAPHLARRALTPGWLEPRPDPTIPVTPADARHVTAEKAVGCKNMLLTLARMGPSRSLSLRAAIQAGSA